MPAWVEHLCILVTSRTGQSLVSTKSGSLRITQRGRTTAVLRLRRACDEADLCRFRNCNGIIVAVLKRDRDNVNGTWRLALVNEDASGNDAVQSADRVSHIGGSLLDAIDAGAPGIASSTEDSSAKPAGSITVQRTAKPDKKPCLMEPCPVGGGLCRPMCCHGARCNKRTHAHRERFAHGPEYVGAEVGSEPDLGGAGRDAPDITGIGNAELTTKSLLAKSAQSFPKDCHGLAEKVIEWKVADVCKYLQALELGHLSGPFRQNAVDGRLLMELSVEDLSKQLQLSNLQARKVRSQLPIWQ